MSLAKTDERRVVWGVSVLLALGVMMVFGQTAWFGFINYDDTLYVYENPVVQQGLTLPGVEWALTYGGIGHWHPLTWLSHMLDSEVYGLWAGGQHLTNVALQAAAAILLFLMLREMTGALWRSAFVAAVFAVHPLRAESVAWIAERKDVLSGVFFMLTLLAYGRYARQPTRRRYFAVLGLFLLGLLSKNMLVTAPFVLLLLDYWPLGRMGLPAAGSGLDVREGQQIPGKRLVWEKTPLFLLTAGSCAITLLAPEGTGEMLPWGVRLENAAVSYVVYLRQLAWPVHLALPYPNPTGELPTGQVLGALGLLAVVSLAAWHWRRERPYLIVGWLWYLGMLAPVIGIVQISYYAHADRYTYLPQIGVVMALTWVAADLVARWRVQSWVAAVAASGLVVALGAQAWRQTGYWRNSETLWRHALACTTDNPMANYELANTLGEEGRAAEALSHLQRALELQPSLSNADVSMGDLLLQLGKTDQAIAHLRRAVEMDSDHANIHNDLGNALTQTGHLEEGVAQLREALRLKPDYALAHYNLGNALSAQGQLREAGEEYEKALAIQPDWAEANYNAGNAVFELGRPDLAVGFYQKALGSNPKYFDALNNLGGAYMNLGRLEEAIPAYRQAHQLQPENVTVLNALAWLLAITPRDAAVRGPEAVALAEQANRLAQGGNLLSNRALAAAYAQTGRYAEAAQTAQAALKEAQNEHAAAMIEALRAELACYQSNQPYREARAAPTGATAP